MAGRTYRGCPWRRAVAALGCMALLLSGCTATSPPPAGPILPATGSSTGPSGAPLAFLPATTGDPSPTAAPGGSAGQAEAPASPQPDTFTHGTAPPVAAYFVLVDDGGRRGVRFGCNDSLVGTARTGSAGDTPLKSAMGALLRAEQHGAQQQPGSMYNALATSRLSFLSGTFDGTKVTVYLAGTINARETCDLPRVEAQLTQTAMEAVGAVRADIYINGRALEDYLREVDPYVNRR